MKADTIPTDFEQPNRNSAGEVAEAAVVSAPLLKLRSSRLLKPGSAVQELMIDSSSAQT